MDTISISPTKSFTGLYDKITKNMGGTLPGGGILLFFMILIVFSLLFSNLGGNSGADMDMANYGNNGGGGILEVIVWSVFIFLLLANGLQYFFGIEATASVKDILSDNARVGIELSDESNSLLKNTLPRIDKSTVTKRVENEAKEAAEQAQKKEVFYIKDNVYTYDEAEAVCKAHNAELADYNQLEKTYDKGGEWCGYGWSKDQMILFPTQKDTWNKLQKMDGHENDCGRPGINGGRIENKNAKFGVNCYGVKRSPNSFELSLLDEMKKGTYPVSKRDGEFRKNVNKFKEKIRNNQMNLYPFNLHKWSH
jgi:hypothetical protein